VWPVNPAQQLSPKPGCALRLIFIELTAALGLPAPSRVLLRDRPVKFAGLAVNDPRGNVTISEGAPDKLPAQFLL
jgi:hypothetical protein